jgi:hypothetical protein
MNQDLDDSADQGNPGLGRVQMMDPVGTGCHASKISLREAKT